MSGPEADFEYSVRTLHYADEVVEVVIIRDLNRGRKSVTNDAENVLAAIDSDLPRSIGDYPVVYYDSDGELDQLLVSGKGELEGYAVLPRLNDLEFRLRSAVRRWAARRRKEA